MSIHLLSRHPQMPHRLRRRRPAINVKNIPMAPVRMEMGREQTDTIPGVRRANGLCTKQESARAISEQDTRAAIVPIEDAGIGSAPITRACLA